MNAARGIAPVTNLARWKAQHSTPPVIAALRWSTAIETTMRANADAAFTLAFLWPRVLLRAMTGV